MALSFLEFARQTCGFLLMIRRSSVLLGLCASSAGLLASPTSAQTQRRALPPASIPAPALTTLPDAPPANQAAFLVDEALDIATRFPAARPVVVRTAAALLPRLGSDGASNRESLTARWMQFAQSDTLSRNARLDAMGSFFDVAARTDADFARSWAVRTPDAAARAGAFLNISRAVEAKSWQSAEDAALLAQRAAQSEEDPRAKARSLVFVAYRMSELSPARTEIALNEATSSVRALPAGAVRDNMSAELVGAQARYDLTTARSTAGRIENERLRTLASARINITEISQTTLTDRSAQRVQALATAAAPYDARALPYLLQLPPEESVLKAVSQTLPPVYVSARPAIETSQLERLWDYSQKAPAGVYRDQLQSRLARLMVTKDLWRGRAWGQQLGWRGGRVQVGAFLKDVLEQRRSTLQAGALQDVAKGNVNGALRQARNLPPAASAEAILLLAGQILS
jgi:hypothetical protein